MDLLRSCWSTRLPAVSHDNAPFIKVSHPVILSNGNEEFFYISENTIEIIHGKKKLNDSEKIKKDILKSILIEENIYSHVWSKGDMLLYDNSQLIHRRESFSGDRFIKALKIYPDPKTSLLIKGRKVSNAKIK
ncbi:TauD/TfdA family dioxygenase [Enterobacter asburiae]|uniref:TauD/TfdA family dioxygenase n=1 Tax=Enterobacter asburiae TaxID=61645 RepID=UPI00287B3A27|nr:TauD/TfdA family dioxygenase [Enterobacter asburiae]MDS1916228.1 TauD/TfdA family dioxygenase [Enterobacter asburiae]